MSGERQGIAAALAAEEEVAAEAAKIREEHEGGLDSVLLSKLTPLLRKPIPGAFIQDVGRVEGKPYASTGIRSVQVQIDRMNNVLGLDGWDFEEEFSADGKLCKVTVYVGQREAPLARRSSHGGVQRGSGTGNLYKGSFTNAAKLAFARIGPGHEIYIDAADLDPDVNAEAAKEIGGGSFSLTAAKAFAARAERVPAAWEALPMAAAHVAEVEKIGDCSTVDTAALALSALTFEQAERLDSWLRRKETEAGVDTNSPAQLSDERVDHLAKSYELAKPTLEKQGAGGSAFDGLNLLLGSLGVNALDFEQPFRDQLATLTEEQADEVDAALQQMVETQDEPAEQGGGEANAG